MPASAERMRVKGSGWALLGLAWLLRIFPLRWLLAAFAAAALHEAGHYCAVYLLGGRVRQLTLGGTGAVMACENLSPGREILCILAGPATGFALLGLLRCFPRLAICGLVTGAYNLLPIAPLDGARALEHLAAIVFSPIAARRISFAAEAACLAVLLAAAVAAWWLHLGLAPLCFVLFMLLRAKNSLQIGAKGSTI